MGKKLNGYYYCLSYSDEHHEVCSIANATREEAIQAAKREGARLYLVRYRNDQQQGKKKRIPLCLDSWKDKCQCDICDTLKRKMASIPTNPTP